MDEDLRIFARRCLRRIIGSNPNKKRESETDVSLSRFLYASKVENLLIDLVFGKGPIVGGRLDGVVFA